MSLRKCHITSHNLHRADVNCETEPWFRFGLSSVVDPSRSDGKCSMIPRRTSSDNTQGYELRQEISSHYSAEAIAKYRFLRSRASSIEGRTTEITKNILGERMLGLPGEPRVDKDVPWKNVPRPLLLPLPVERRHGSECPSGLCERGGLRISGSDSPEGSQLAGSKILTKTVSPRLGDSTS